MSKQIKVPESIKVYGKDLKITQKKIMIMNETLLSGCFYPETFTVEIADKTHTTLLHELIHALFFRIGLRQAGLSEELEELIAENISVFMDETYDLRFKKDGKKGQGSRTSNTDAPTGK